jgi:hypothetical protein
MEASRPGETRRASHYLHGRQIVCVPCGEAILEEHGPGEWSALQICYFIGRPMLCGHCHAKLGPWEGNEIEPGELQKAMALYSRSRTLQARPTLEDLVEAARTEADG